MEDRHSTVYKSGKYVLSLSGKINRSPDGDISKDEALNAYTHFIQQSWDLLNYYLKYRADCSVSGRHLNEFKWDSNTHNFTVEYTLHLKADDDVESTTLKRGLNQLKTSGHRSERVNGNTYIFIIEELIF